MLHPDIVPLYIIVCVLAGVTRIVAGHCKLISRVVILGKLRQVLQAWHILKVNTYGPFDITLLDFLGVIKVFVDNIWWNEFFVWVLIWLLYANT